MLLSQAGKNAFASLDLVDPISSSNRDPKRKDPSPKAVQSVGYLHNPGTPPQEEFFLTSRIDEKTPISNMRESPTTITH